MRQAQRAVRSTNPPRGVVRGHVVEAVKIMQSRLAETWTITMLAQEIHLSRTQLIRCFSTVTGGGPMTYLKRLRTDEMARLLLTTDLPIGAIALRVGWNDPGFAGRLFRTRYGVTPTEYRRQHASPLT